MAEPTSEQREAEARTAAAFRRVGSAASLPPQTLARIGERIRQRRERRQLQWIWSLRLASAAVSVLLALGGARAAIVFYRGAEPASSITGPIWRALHPVARSPVVDHNAVPLPPPAGPSSAMVPTVPSPAQAPELEAASKPPSRELPLGPSEVEDRGARGSAPRPSAVARDRSGRTEIASKADATSAPPSSPPPVTLGVLASPTPPAPLAENAAPPPAPAPPSELAQQMEWLQRAQRHADDPPAELEILDGYLALYPRGLLRGEVQVARVDALLREGEKAHAIDALDELHRQGFAGLPRGGELSVLRAELLAQADRCAEALPDLQESTGRAAALAERVLYARAYCLSRTGDAAGGRHGYQDYLRRFPKGRFAAQAHQALGE